MNFMPRFLSLLCCALVLAIFNAAARAEEKKSEAPSSPPSVTITNAVKHVDAKEAAKLVAKGEVVVLDIRTDAEFEEGHIAGAKNLDFQDKNFLKQMEGLDRNQPYLLHCASGGRSTRCLAKIKDMGFKNIIHLDGGFNAWEKAGNPVEKGTK